MSYRELLISKLENRLLKVNELLKGYYHPLRVGEFLWLEREIEIQKSYMAIE